MLDPVLASASFPIVLPPVMIDGFQLTDGGVTAVVPIEVALLRGATELYVIDLEPDVSKTQPIHGVLPIARQTLMTSLREQLIDDLRDASHSRRHRAPRQHSRTLPISIYLTSRRQRS